MKQHNTKQASGITTNHTLTLPPIVIPSGFQTMLTELVASGERRRQKKLAWCAAARERHGIDKERMGGCPFEEMSGLNKTYT